MKRRPVVAILVTFAMCLIVWLIALAGPPPWKDCIYSGTQCVWPLGECIHPILLWPGVMETCIEEWYCPEYYWEPCGACPCVVI